MTSGHAARSNPVGGRVRRDAALAAAASILAAVAGCASTRGPALVVDSHVEYNKAVGQVLKEELLLNVVRRRYLESPQFLNVSSISSNFTTSTGFGVGASILGICATCGILYPSLPAPNSSHEHTCGEARYRCLDRTARACNAGDFDHARI